MQQLNIKSGPNYIPLVLCILLSAAAIIFFTYPKYNDLLLKREELQKAQESLQNFNDDYNLVVKAIGSLGNPDVANLTVALPADPNIPLVYAQLEQLSQNANMHIVSITAMPEDPNNPPPTPAPPATPYLITPPAIPSTLGVLDITLTVIGSYNSHVQLVQAIKNSLRILDIQQADLEATKTENGAVSSDVSGRYLIKAYYEKSNQK